MGYFLTVANRIWETSILAVGSHLTLGLGGILFLGFPAAFWCGAYGYAIAAKVGLSVAVSLSVGVFLSAAMGALFAFLYSRMSNESFSVITLASVVAMDALIRSWDSVTGGVLGISGVPRFFSDQTLGSLMVFQTFIAVVCLVFESLLISSPFGRALRAAKENKNALTALGTSASMTGKVAVLFASLFAGMAGILAAMRIQFLDPSLGGLLLLAQIITIAIVVGTAKTLRLFVITAVIVLLPESLRFLNLPTTIIGYSRNFLYGIVLIVLIYYMSGKNPYKRNV